MTCAACGVETENKMCLMCLLWEGRARNNRSSKNQVRVNGKFYLILAETRQSRFSEGAHQLYGHHIQFKNGKTAYTTNLTLCGEIPEYFKSRLSDNAEFIELPQLKGHKHDDGRGV